MIAVLLLAFQMTAAPQPAEQGSLSGTVVNAATGEPAGKVRITLEPEGARGGPAPAALTDASGSFRLVKLEPGRYRLRASRNGFLETYYGARRANASGALLKIEPGQEIKDLRIKLQPFGVITGTIRDFDGEPLPGATVSALRLVYEKGKRTPAVAGRARTDDIGQYRIAGLPAGRYYVRARPQESDSDFIPVDRSGSDAAATVLAPALYPGVTESRSAAPVEVGPGARVSGIDMALPQMQVFHVKGRVAVPEGDVIMASVRLFPAGALEDEMVFHNLEARLAKDGSFDVREVPAGSYRLEATVLRKEDGGNRVLGAYADVTVNRSDVTRVQVAPESGAEIRARVTVEGEAAPQLEGVHLSFNGVDNPLSFNTFLRLGENVFDFQLRRGRYAVAVEFPRQHGSLFLKSARTETADVLAEGLTIAGPGKIEVNIVMSREAGKVAGVVAGEDGNSVPGATVVAVPADRPARTDLLREGTTDQNGRFELASLPPGDYRVFAWDDVEPGRWFDPKFLKRFEAKAETVKVAAKGESRVTLRAAPALAVGTPALIPVSILVALLTN